MRTAPTSPEDISVTTPGGKVPTAVQAAWARGKKQYALTLMFVFIGILGSFMPAIIVWLETGEWYMNVVTRDHQNPFKRLVNAHAITALVMLGMLVAQVFTGVTGKSTDDRRAYHRVIGKFVLAPLLVISLSLAALSEMMANSAGADFSFITMLTVAVIFTTFGCGYRAALKKRYAEHKDWMLWTIILVSETGMTRIGMYAAQPYMNCDAFLSDIPFFVSVVLATLTAWTCLRSVDRIGRKYKANVALFIIHIIIGGYALASSAMFECPENRLLVRPVNTTIKAAH